MWEFLYHKMYWIQDQFHMESGWSGPNDEKEFQDIVEEVKKLECYFIIYIYDNHIQQTKHDVVCG